MVYNGDNKQLNLTQSKELTGVVSHSYFYKQYIEPQQVSKNFEAAVRAMLANSTKLEKFLKYNKATLYKTDFNIRMLISNLGNPKASPSIISFQVKNLEHDPEIKSVSLKGNQIEITKKNGQLIRSMVLSKTFGWLAGDKVLESPFRDSKSHEKSMELSRNLTRQNTLVTGWVTGLTSNTKFLQSWIETELDGKDIVIDPTTNAIINKSGFYNLRHASSVSRINNSDLETDLELITPFVNKNQLSALEYLVYRDKVIEALKESENQ